MSDAMMDDFIKMADSFSGEELVSAISILSEKLKKVFVNENDGKDKDLEKRKKALKKLFARADALHLNSHGAKWTREELYER